MKKIVDVRNLVKGGKSEGFRKGTKVKPTERSTKQLVHEIDDNITEGKAFPEFKATKARFAEDKQALDAVNMILKDPNGVEKVVMNRPGGVFGLEASPAFGGLETKDAFRRILNKVDPGVFEEAIKIHGANAVFDAVKRVFGILAA